jgi:hypothetical protein
LLRSGGIDGLLRAARYGKGEDQQRWAEGAKKCLRCETRQVLRHIENEFHRAPSFVG